MLILAIRKMLSNKWLVICILLGLIISVAVISCIPIYTDGILQRMLTKDLEIQQQESGVYSGNYTINADFSFSEDSSNFEWLDNKINGVVAKTLGIPLLSLSCNPSGFATLLVEDLRNNGKKKGEGISVNALTDLSEHIKITHGKMYSKEKQNNEYEAIITQAALRELDLILGKSYEIEKIDPSRKDSSRIKIVGVFTYKDISDTYWVRGVDTYNKSVFIDYNLLMNDFVKNESKRLSKAQWNIVFDYHKIKLDNLTPLISALEAHIKWFQKYRLEYNIPTLSILKKYGEREKQLKLTLLILQIPVFLMLLFYIFMASKQKIDFESNDIAVLKSRGTSSLKLFNIYLIECIILGVIALLIGPMLGILLCEIIGASNGFMDFVQRAALPVNLGLKAYLYSLVAVGVFSISMLTPAFIASRESIVIFKQNKSRLKKTTFWKKSFLDVILFAVAIYGYYSYTKQMKTITVSGAKGVELGIDPLLFFISTIFILGAGLLFLRVFPYVVNLIFFVGNKVWSPVFYASFKQVAKGAGQGQFVMLFIILTLSIGIFSANTARTLNKNMEDKIMYSVGTDTVVKEYWSDNQVKYTSASYGEPEVATKKEELHYYEPPFEPYTKLQSVENLTKVFNTNDGTIQISSEWINNVTVMGIIPNEFGKVAWFRNGLLPYHWYEYLNLMTDYPTAFLASKSLKEKYNLKEGDSIYVRWGGQDWINGVVYEFVDYWPTLNPNKKVDGGTTPCFIIANLNYIHSVLSVEPYEVWMKMKPNVSSNEVYREMEKADIQIDSRKDAKEQIIKKKNDPMLQGTNGTLTLGFIIVVIISAIGFIIFWVLSLKKRVLQFGIFRAMGLSFGKIIGMIACEQVMITGTAFIAGIVIGSITSKIFVPLLQIVYNSEEQVPPFQVISYMEDYYRLYAVVGFMLLIVFIVLYRIIRRINIGQALKLGED